MNTLRISLRYLFKKPAHAIMALVSIAIGIGATTSMFGVIEAVLAREPHGVQNAHELVALYVDDRNTPKPDYLSFAYPDYENIRKHQTVFTDLAAYARTPITMSGDIETMPVTGEFVSVNYFSLLGVPLNVTGDEVVISDRLWQTAFGRDPGILNRHVKLNGRTFSIGGVAPEKFSGILLDWIGLPDVWLPIEQFPFDILKRRAPFHMVVGRLKPGVEPSAAQAQFSTLLGRIDPLKAVTAHSVVDARFWPGHRERVIPILGVLMTVGSLILLAACFNAANFLLGQATARRKDVAVRMAIGATRRQIIGQLLTESAILALLSAAGGLILASWLSSLIANSPRAFRINLHIEPALDWRVMAFALAVTVVAVFTFGLLPALAVSRRDPGTVLKEIGGGRFSSALGWNSRQVLLVLQVTMAVVLAVVAGLYARSLRNLVTIDPGFSTDGIIVANIDAMGLSPGRATQFYRQLLDQVNSIPGVQASSMSSQTPLSSSRGSTLILTPNTPSPRRIDSAHVSSSYFQTLGLAIQNGVPFADVTTPNEGDIMINDVLASELWPKGDAIGATLQMANEKQSRRIVGVVKQTNCSGFLPESRPCVYQPFPLAAWPGTLTLRGNADVRKIAFGINPEVAVSQVRTLDDFVREQTSGQRISAAITGVLAVIGILLVTIGCFALFSSIVRESRREIGLRMALGATTGLVLRQVLFRSAVLSLAGIAAGLSVSVGISRFLAADLYKIGPHDFPTFAGVVVLVFSATLVATFLPAKAASETEPAEALRQS